MLMRLIGPQAGSNGTSAAIHRMPRIDHCYVFKHEVLCQSKTPPPTLYAVYIYTYTYMYI